MKPFKDSNGRQWSVHVNVASIKRVRALTGHDLLTVYEGKLVDKLARDPVMLCDILYALCEPEAVQAGINDEKFAEAMAGDAIENATAALLEELVSFCPSPRDRQNLGRALEAQKSVMNRARDLIDVKIAKGELERVADQALEEAFPEISGSASGAAPGSSA